MSKRKTRDALETAIDHVRRLDDFRNAPVSGKLFGILAKWAREHDRAITQEALAEALYGDAFDDGRTRTAVGALRSRLERVQAGQRQDLPRLVVPLGEYRLAVASPEEAEPPVQLGRTGAAPMMRLAGVLVATALLFIMASVLRSPPTVSSLSRTERAILLLDESGEELHRLTFSESLRDDPMNGAVRLDLNRDGVDDWAFIVRVVERDRAPWVVFVDGLTATELARVTVGSRLEGAARDLPLDFAARSIVPLHADGQVVAVAVASYNVYDSLACIETIRSDGTLIDRYWTFGHVLRMIPVDVDLDGDEELIALLLHDQPDDRRAAIVVLEPGHASGYAPHDAELGEFPRAALRGGQSLYVLFPRSDLTSPEHRSVPLDLSALPDGGWILRVAEHDPIQAGTTLAYHLDRTLRAVKVRGLDAFRVRRQERVAAGELDGDTDASYYTALVEAVRYHWNDEWRDYPPESWSTVLSPGRLH